MGLREKGETAAEVSGTARALRAVMVPVVVPDAPVLVDTCGTVGGAVGTLNISTAAAFVATAAGARVAKHGNRSYTSRCGSADLLESMGVNIMCGAEQASRVLASVGMVFLFAPNYHPAMRHVAPVRRELKVATIMNLVGPLANPAGVRRQVVGVADAARAPLMAEALAELGTEHALVAHGEIGMDEISPAGRTTILEVRGGAVLRWTLDPAEYGLDWDRPEELAGGEPAENAVRTERLFEGRGDEADRRAVLLNAAAAIYVSGVAVSFGAAVGAATEALERGGARRVLEALRRAGGPVSTS
ncbi:MAG: anthranilate phosphoribosyltransferase [Gemmatimonadales bacterium]|nr:MAG: anthranilate phosphoribosyltransferase [Gemmatimonadales bacterium]